MTFALLFIIPICYGCIQFLELSAVLARIAGIRKERVMLGYSIQQSVYMGTRFFLVAILPLLGLMVDRGITHYQFEMVAHASLFLATILGFVAFFLAPKMVAYYGSVIEGYGTGQTFIRSFFVRPPKKEERILRSSLFDLLKNPETRKTFMLSNLVFVIYSTGMFASFYFALLFFDYRASISHMSGVVNAFGAVVLTFVVEPHISKSMDTRDSVATDLIFSLFWGRLFATGVTGQLLLLALFAAA